jgi:hypothetical protein
MLVNSDPRNGASNHKPDCMRRQTTARNNLLHGTAATHWPLHPPRRRGCLLFSCVSSRQRRASCAARRSSMGIPERAARTDRDARCVSPARRLSHQATHALHASRPPRRSICPPRSPLHIHRETPGGRVGGGSTCAPIEPQPWGALTSGATAQASRGKTSDRTKPQGGVCDRPAGEVPRAHRVNNRDDGGRMYSVVNMK